MIEALELSNNPVDVVGIILLALAVVGVAIWFIRANVRGVRSLVVSARPHVQATVRAFANPQAAALQRQLEQKREAALLNAHREPQRRSSLDNLDMLMKRAEPVGEHRSAMTGLHAGALQALDATEGAYLALCREIASVSSYARMRTERPALTALGAAAAAMAGSQFGSDAEPRMDADKARSTKHRDRAAA